MGDDAGKFIEPTMVSSFPDNENNFRRATKKEENKYKIAQLSNKNQKVDAKIGEAFEKNQETLDMKKQATEAESTKTYKNVNDRTQAPLKPSISPLKRKIIISGAGPVGLWLAHLLIDTADIDITVIESRKETEYNTRHQQMIIEDDLFNMLPSEIQNELLQNPNACKIFKPPAKLIKNYCFSKDFPDAPINGYSIMTSTLQTLLYNYIKKSNKITFLFDTMVKKALKNVLTIETKGAKQKTTMPYDTLIISSGKISDVLDTSYNIKNKKVDNNTYYGAAINIEIKPGILNPIIPNPDTKLIDLFKSSNAQHRFRFFRQQENNLYAAINLSKEEYETYLKRFNGKNSNTEEINATNTFKDLLAYVASIIAMYTGKSYDNILANIIIKPKEFSIFPIEILSTSPPFYKNGTSEYIYIIGDAVQNTHFFTGYGVNLGFYTANKVAEILKKNKYEDAENEDFKSFIESKKTDILDKIKGVMVDFNKTCTEAEITAFKVEQKTKDMDLSNLPAKDICYIIPKKTTNGSISGGGRKRRTHRKRRITKKSKRSRHMRSRHMRSRHTRSRHKRSRPSKKRR
jgi:2-polyprenyl-6-methoxyphenol hydroxylase-like FAD-dependent oxidoreductase